MNSKLKLATALIAAATLASCGSTPSTEPKSETSETEIVSSEISAPASSSDEVVSSIDEVASSEESSSSDEMVSSEEISSSDEVVEPLILTKSSIAAIDPDGKATSYATYDGEHSVGNYTVTTSNVMPQNSASSYNTDCLQFKAAVGYIKVSGIFNTIKLTTYSTYDYDNNFTFTCGETAMAIDSDIVTTDTGLKYNDKYAVKSYTITARVAAEAISEYTISKTVGTKGAGYVTLIELN